MPQDAPSSGLLKLAPETVTRILDFAPLENHLAVALTCRQLYKGAAYTLERHREAHAKYCVTSDLSVYAIPDLVEALFRDDIQPWHVRELEFWGGRTTWGEWRSRRPLESGSFVMRVDEGPVSERFRSIFNEEEHVKRCLDLARAMWGARIPAHDLEEAGRQLRCGSDGFLAMLVMASCPRLRSVAFAATQRWGQTCLRWLQRAVRWTRDSHPRIFPPGLASIRHLRLGVCTTDERDIVLAQIETPTIEAAMKLPSIKTLYIRHATLEPGRGRAAPDHSDLSPGESSLEHLYLDDFFALGRVLESKILRAPRGLVSLTIREKGYNRIRDADAMWRDLAVRSGKSLEKFIVYNNHAVRAGEDHTHWHVGSLAGFEAIRHTSFAMADLERGWARREGEEGTKEAFADFILATLPRSLKVVKFWGETQQAHYGDEDPSLFLEAAVIALIESDDFASLEAVYLDEYVRSPEHDIPAGEPLFQRAVDVGRGAGVHVHTLTNLDDSSINADFPPAPDKYDYKTGGHGQRPRHWRVSHRNGCWEAAGVPGPEPQVAEFYRVNAGNYYIW